MKKKSQPRSLGTVLQEVLPQLPGGGGSPEYLMLCTLWRETVGASIAAHTSPAAVYRNCLTVHVSSSVWMQQLHFMRETILAKLNRGLAASPLAGLRFKIGPVPGLNEEDEALPPLDAAGRRSVEVAAAGIADPELRAAFTGLMEAYLKNRQDR
jgi:predicted nucleic acid-binding Zn ribbon protein